MGIPAWKGGGRRKISHLGTPHNHKVFVTIWGLTYMLIPVCAQLHYAKINGPKYAFLGIFCIWGSPYANFSCAKCVQIPICESPYATKYCSNTQKTNFLRIWDPRTHNEVVPIWRFTYTSWATPLCLGSVQFLRLAAKEHKR